jgi:hypothetical protein
MTVAQIVAISNNHCLGNFINYKQGQVFIWLANNNQFAFCAG